MKEGGRRKLVIYPEAGYGKAGSLLPFLLTASWCSMWSC